MSQLNLKITGMENLGNADLLLNGKHVKMKRNEFGNVVVKRHDLPEKVNVELISYLDFGGPIWFILQIFFFLISIFGILDRHGRKSYTAVHFVGTIDTTAGEPVVIRCSRKTGDEMVITTEGKIEVTQNVCQFNRQAQRTAKVLRFAKLAAAIAVVVLGIVIAIN